MKNKNVVPIILLSTGLILVIISIYFKTANLFDTYKSLSGVMIGLGSGLFSAGLASLVNSHLIEKDPALKRKVEVEAKDERNIYINNNAKAKAFDVIGFVFPTIMFIQILLEVDFIITIIMIIGYLLMYAIQIYYLNKYSKEM